METAKMINKILKRRNAIGTGECVGTINAVEQFNASLVELFEQTFPLPHGEAYVMFARQRNPNFTTKEITLSFSKGLAEDTYELTPTSHEVRLTFLDNNDSEKPLTYTQSSGAVKISYDPESATLSGSLNNVVVVNRDDDELKELTLEIRFSVKGDIVKLRGYRSIAA
jgi:hypothetical protein